MKRTSLFLFLTLACGAWLQPIAAQAHFLWLVRDAQHGGKIQVYFGEAAEPDDPALLSKVAAAEVWSLEGRGQPKSLPLTHSSDSLTADQARPATSILRHNYGVVEKGGAPFLLKYYAKAYPYALPGTWNAVRDAERLPLEVTPALAADGLRLTVTWAGKPLPGAVVTVNGPGIDSKLEGPADAEGRFVCQLAQPGLYSIRAKHSEETAGTHDGKEYKSVRHYSTLSLNYAPAQLSPAAHDLPPLAKGTTSFGGAVVGDALFVYGGNYGSAHEYANEDQSGDLWRLDLHKPGQWEVVSTGPRLQGLAMVEHRGKLIRVGGFTAQNKTGEPQNLVSQSDVARFDPQTRTWESLPSLPQPRSSHDAALIGDTLYVVGGWALKGESKNSQWHETALALDLSADKLAWREIAAPPFKRRALALAEWRGKLVCVGGMMESGGPTTAVAIYDPAANRWSEGPALQGSAMDGFGASAFACQNSLYVTTVTGSIQRLSGEGKAWEYVGQLAQPRFFHRLLPWQGTQLLVVGGANMEEGKTEALEKLNTATAQAAGK
ncbi:MAG: kelch repeat-containing protein [Pirellulales bacterium]